MGAVAKEGEEKRGRGRPPKDGVAAKKQAYVPTGRPRGRPPGKGKKGGKVTKAKSPAKAKSPGRGRGRPKKAEAEEEEEENDAGSEEAADDE